MQGHEDLVDALGYVDPARLGYQEWVDVGFALHEAGLPVEAWDEWSRRDPERYHEGECARKWAGFGSGAGRHVGPGTLARMAMAAGWSPSGPDEGFGWDEPVRLADPAWVEDERPSGCGLSPCGQLSAYLAALFDDSDRVGYVCQSWETPDGRKVPTRGNCGRTAGELRQELAKAPDLGAVLGDYDPEVGAWIRFNPLDGRGVGNANVTEYRYALVESDTLPVEKQLGMIRSMNLPCAAIVSSGGKSVHAIVRVDAGRDFDLYRRRVEELYAWVRRQGFEPDAQNKNPSRLSRLPGANRRGHAQELLATDQGPASWEEWAAWRDEREDDLPEDTNSDWDEPVVLAPPLIGTEEDGILRQGQKMVLAGPSKAGKSYALIDLAEAIACGGTWLGWPCAEGPVYYVNLEIADSSFRQRQHVVWADREAHGQVGSGVGSVKRNFVRLDLRGRACDMETLAPRICRRMLRRGPRGHFMACVIDPIYKVNGGDENDASAISRFTNQLDRIARECGCAVIYAHHHAKGALGARKALDRMSGSGVFARDADAILDLSQLRVPDGQEGALGGATAWRLTATLREFRSPEPVDLVFAFPRMLRDPTGRMGGWDVEGENPWREAAEEKAGKKRREYEGRVSRMRAAYSALVASGTKPTRRAVLDAMNADGGEEVGMAQLRAWTSDKAPWSPFRCDTENGNALTDTARDPIDWGD